MLITVKSIIGGIPDIPFSEYYQNYVCEVQDENVIMEIRQLRFTDYKTFNIIKRELNRK